MTMQHKRSSFRGVDISRYVSVPRKDGGEEFLRQVALSKADHATDELTIRIDHLSMASRSVVERISADEGMRPHWYCLRVMTGREFAVEKRLLESDVECLVVRTNPTKVVRRKRVMIIPAKPVIAGYVLVRCLPLPAAMMGLVHIDDVLDVVGGAVTPYRADEKSVNLFKKMAEEGKYDHQDRAKHSFMLKEGIRVADGPFASFPGTITAIDDERSRVTVDVDIFGRATPVELDIAQIEKV